MASLMEDADLQSILAILKKWNGPVIQNQAQVLSSYIDILDSWLRQQKQYLVRLSLLKSDAKNTYSLLATPSSTKGDLAGLLPSIQAQAALMSSIIESDRGALEKQYNIQVNQGDVPAIVFSIAENASDAAAKRYIALYDHYKNFISFISYAISMIEGMNSNDNTENAFYSKLDKLAKILATNLKNIFDNRNKIARRLAIIYGCQQVWMTLINEGYSLDWFFYKSSNEMKVWLSDRFLEINTYVRSYSDD